MATKSLKSIASERIAKAAQFPDIFHRCQKGTLEQRSVSIACGCARWVEIAGEVAAQIGGNRDAAEAMARVSINRKRMRSIRSDALAPRAAVVSNGTVRRVSWRELDDTLLAGDVIYAAGVKMTLPKGKIDRAIARTYIAMAISPSAK